jgi:hypothetical protein
MAFDPDAAMLKITNVLIAAEVSALEDLDLAWR